MNYSFRNNVWKGGTTDVVVPTNSRPFHNSDSALSTLQRTPYAPNPIKHWRKQISPYYKTASSKQVSIDQIMAPSTSISVADNSVDCDTENKQLLKENITILSQCNGLKIDGSLDSEARCIGGTNNVRRSASTNIKKNYYRSNSSYLKAKCKTYAENSSLGTKNSDGTYMSTKCSDDALDCNKPIVYKVSNSKFSQQGAVSSSANILRKKNDAITRNNASLKTAYGNGIVSLTAYHDSGSSPGYAIKYVKGDVNNLQKCDSAVRKYPC